MDYPPLSPDGQPILPAVAIELKGILGENGHLSAEFTASPSQRVVSVNVAELLSFSSFRRLVLKRFDLRIVYRGDRWFRDIIGAAQRGGVPVKVDQLAGATSFPRANRRQHILSAREPKRCRATGGRGRRCAAPFLGAC